MEMVRTIIIAASIPSTIVSFLFWYLKKKITDQDKEREKRAKKQEALQLIILDSINGTMTLSEATARAVQRIPDAKCNGDMHAALDKITKVREKQQKLIIQEGIHGILKD